MSTGHPPSPTTRGRRADGVHAAASGPRRCHARTLSGADALDHLPDADWDRLLLGAAAPDPLRRADVLRGLAGAGVRPRVLLVERDGDLVGGAALAVVRRRGLRVVRHLGPSSGWVAPEPVAADRDARAALVQELTAQGGDVLELEDLAREGALVTALAEQPGAEVIDGPVSWLSDVTADTPGAARRRKEASRTLRRAAEAGRPLGVEVLTRWADIAPRLAGLLEFQARCRAGRDMDDLTGTEDGRARTHAMIAALGGREAVRVATVHAGGRLVAFHLALVAGCHAVGFKTAACREDRALSGVGWCSMFALHDHLASEGVETVDMGHGGDAHKKAVARSRPLATVRVGLSPAGRAYLAAVRARRDLLRRAATSGTPAGALCLGPSMVGL